jgi:hypothetical protein
MPARRTDTALSRGAPPTPPSAAGTGGIHRPLLLGCRCTGQSIVTVRRSHRWRAATIFVPERMALLVRMLPGTTSLTSVLSRARCSS